MSYIFSDFAALLIDMQANKLTTVKKCLNEVLKYGGPFNPRDLYPVRSILKICERRCADYKHTVPTGAVPNRLDAQRRPLHRRRWNNPGGAGHYQRQSE